MNRNETGSATGVDITDAERPHGVIGVHGVRYQVKDVARAVSFYTGRLGFKLEHQQLPAFASISLGAFTLLLIHAGLLLPGYEHRAARNAESVIAAVLFVGLVASLIFAKWTRQFGMTVQGFALVGAFTIVVGVGPRTLPDIGYHVGMIALLIGGLVVAAQNPAVVRK